MPLFTPTGVTGRNAAAYHVGLAAVIGGGLVAAATRPLDFDMGSWLAAYLVLVLGVCGCGIACAPALLGTPAAARPRLVQWGLWWAGNAVVIIGTLSENTAVTDVGAVVLIAALILALAASRGATKRPVAAGVYRVVLAVLIVSAPIGLLLAAIGS